MKKKRKFFVITVTTHDRCNKYETRIPVAATCPTSVHQYAVEKLSTWFGPTTTCTNGKRDHLSIEAWDMLDPERFADVTEIKELFALELQDVSAPIGKRTKERPVVYARLSNTQEQTT